jgi:hypothetical protein
VNPIGKRFLIAVIGAAALIAPPLPAPGPLAPPPAAAAARATVVVDGTRQYGPVEEVVRLVNVARADEGLRELTMSPELTESAMVRAAEVALRHSHTRPSGVKWSSALPEEWGGTAGENIAWGFGTAADVVKAWLASPGHRLNILNPDFRSIGIGVFHQGADTNWTQLFSGAGPAGKKLEEGDVEVGAKIAVDPKGDFTLSARLKPSGTLRVGRSAGVETTFAWEGASAKLRASSLAYSRSGGAVRVDDSGTVKAVKPGSATVRVAVSGAKNSSVSVKVKVAKLGKAALKATSPGSGKVKASWKTVSGASGYQVAVAANKDFSKAVTKRLAKKGGTKSLTIDRADLRGKSCYVRVRPYVKAGAKRAYGAWSTPKRVKVKR